MKLTLSTAPDIYPIDVDDVKDHLRLSGESEDEYLQGLIYTAIDWAEQFTNRRFCTQTWKAYLDDWPKGDFIRLPFGNLASVTSVVYTDSNEDDTTWDTDEYIVDTDAEPGRIVLTYGYQWPSFTGSPNNPICITFICGQAVASVSITIKHALKIIVTDLYENRESHVTQNLRKLNTVENLLTPHKLWSCYP